MSTVNEEGVLDVTDAEAKALAWRLCAAAVRDLIDSGRLDWEDVPSLSERAWEQVAAQWASLVAPAVAHAADVYDRLYGTDSHELLREAT